MYGGGCENQIGSEIDGDDGIDDDDTDMGTHGGGGGDVGCSGVDEDRGGNDGDDYEQPDNSKD